jgi:C1A family cysteine protease|uniref:Peptidase C1A papain C-terminal domain-containing protein n=1 Tax=viral metagenome TaxID=1070528 RepID=A0A6C0J1D7_9ZZZZ
MLSTMAKLFGLITVFITFLLNTESFPSRLKNELFNKSVYDYHSLLVYNTITITISNSNNSSYKLSLNKFAGYNSNDFSKMYKGYKPSYYQSDLVILPNITQKSVDWRNSTIVGPLKDQRQCGSCCAFSAQCLRKSSYEVI